MRIVFAGTPAIAIPTLDALVEAGHEVALVVTREDAPFGRSRRMRPSPIAAHAAELGLPILRANRLGDRETATIADRQPELGVVVAYGALLREPLLAVPEHGWINLHFSPLPRWRGAAPVQRALLAGDTTTAVSVFALEAGLDTGPVFRAREVAIGPDETAGELLERLGRIGAPEVIETVAAIAAGTARATPQRGSATSAPKLARADGRIDWRRSVDEVHARIRAVTPEPGAAALLGERRVKLLEVRGLSDEEPAEIPDPGEVRLTRAGVVVGCGDGRALRLVRVQPAGSRAMDAEAWMRGRVGRETRFA